MQKKMVLKSTTAGELVENINFLNLSQKKNQEIIIFMINLRIAWVYKYFWSTYKCPDWL